jgi:hypothetical protein
MSRGFAYGLLAAVGVAVAYGLLWLLASWGLVVVAAFGGWLIGVAMARGLAVRHTAADWPRGASAVAALVAAAAWLGGTYLAFAIVQLMEGSRGIAERLAPAHFLANLAAIADPPWMQLAIIAAFCLAAAYGARAPRSQTPSAERA